MATVTPNIPISLGGLAGWLIRDGLLNEADARQAYAQTQKQKIPFVTYLVEHKLVRSRELASAASQEFGVPLFDIDAMELEATPVKLVDEKLIRKHCALPLFKRGNRLFVGVSDPTNLQALDDFKFHTGINTEAILVEADKLTKAIDRALEANDPVIKEMLDEDLDNIAVSAGEEEAPGGDITELDVNDAPVVRFVNKMLLDAIKKGASDIHFEPYEKSCRVRFRQDGILHEVVAPPVTLAGRLAARIKVMARLDIAERRVPPGRAHQDDPFQQARHRFPRERLPDLGGRENCNAYP
jgi:Type II secretory pathway, ATPase PulE/Tfp pilus assembly pathway, ATPase PilB